MTAHLFLPLSPAGWVESPGSPVAQAQDEERETFLYTVTSVAAEEFRRVLLRKGERPQEVWLTTIVESCWSQYGLWGLSGIGIRLDIAHDELICDTCDASGR